MTETVIHPHSFRRYVRRMVGRRMRYEAMCSCGWRSGIWDSQSDSFTEFLKHRGTEPKIKKAGWLIVGDRLLCAGLVYRVVAVGKDEIFALREDDTGSITLRIHDDAPIELYEGPLHDSE